MCFLCWGHPALAVPAGDIAPDKAQVTDTAQDNTGQIWSISREGLLRWDRTAWKPVALVAGLPTDASPLALGSMPTQFPVYNGSVACIWKVDSTHEALSLLHGMDSRFVTVWPSSQPPFQVIGDSHGNVWVTYTDGSIYRIPVAAGVISSSRFMPEHVITISPDQRWTQNKSSQLNPLYGVEDGYGRM